MVCRATTWLLRNNKPNHRDAAAAILQRSYHRKDPFTDRVKALISSGAGGDGASIMSHEHTNEFAGPGGGNGGRGGHVFLRTAQHLSDLAHVKRLGPQVTAESGSIGFSRVCHGKSGRDRYIDLPLGTQVVDVDTNEVLYDLDEPSTEVLLLEGGQGGKGNASFANRRHHSPVESTNGLPGNTILAQFELKSIADCGLVGFPNAGKSSLLHAISASKPKIAPYAFTTVHPWIGVINDLYGNSCRVADLPGLIEGAYENRGLGHQFLRHVERAKVLCFVVDMHHTVHPFSERSTTKFVEPIDVLETLVQELEFYLPGLSERGAMVFANKMDAVRDTTGRPLADKLETLQRQTHLPVFPISAKIGIERGLHDADSGLEPAIQFLCQRVFAQKSDEVEERRQRRDQERAALEAMYQSKHRGSYRALQHGAPARNSSNHSPAGMPGMDHRLDASISRPSLVDQQLFNDTGASGYGEVFDAYQSLPAEGRLTDKRDVSLQGKYWSLTREQGEKLPVEKW